MLGLMLSRLARVGDSVSDNALLAFQRPLLTWLLIFWAPAMFHVKISEFVNLFDILDGVAFKGVMFVGVKAVKG